MSTFERGCSTTGIFLNMGPRTLSNRFGSSLILRGGGEGIRNGVHDGKKGYTEKHREDLFIKKKVWKIHRSKGRKTKISEGGTIMAARLVRQRCVKERGEARLKRCTTYP